MVDWRASIDRPRDLDHAQQAAQQPNQEQAAHESEHRTAASIQPAQNAPADALLEPAADAAADALAIEHDCADGYDHDARCESGTTRSPRTQR